MDIEILNEQSNLNIDEQLNQMIENLVEKCMEEEGLSFDGEVSILFVSDERIHELNLEHRSKDTPTDVLSFPQYPSLKDSLIQDPYVILGDVVISTDTCRLSGNTEY